MNKEQELLLNLTALSIADNNACLIWELEQLKGMDWKTVVNESLLQAIPILAFDTACAYKDYIPEDIYDSWTRLAANALTARFYMLQAQEDLIALIKAKYPYVILKGTSAAAYYPEPEFRALGDVDFLIQKKDKHDIEKLLLSAGYTKKGGKHPNHVVFSKERAYIEMHFDVAGIPYGWRGDEVRDFLKQAVLQPVEKTQSQQSFYAPQDMYHGLILLLHMQHHMLGEGLGVRHLTDWAVYVKQTYQQAFWEDKLIPFLKKIGLFYYAQVMTKTCALYLKINCPNWCMEIDDEVCELVIQDILDSGNFGRKNENRAKSAMLVSERGKNGMKHSAFYNLAHGLHTSVMLKYPIIKKIPILYPFLYSWRALRFLFLSIIGKRPSLHKMLPEAKKRKAVYTKLKIFE